MTAGDDVRVCPHCGEPPGEGVFCAACGHNLSAVNRLPTRAEWEIASTPEDRPLADRCAEATAAFLAAMHAAGDPGTKRTAISSSGWRRRHVDGWVVRAVERDEHHHLPPRHYEPGLVLRVEGAINVLDNE